MSAPFLTALSLLAGALLLAAAALALGRLLRPAPVHPRSDAPAVPDVAGAAVHSWHLVALGALFQFALILLLAWGLVFRDLVQAGSPALLGLLAFLLILALGLAHAWRRGLLDTGPLPDVTGTDPHGPSGR